MKNGKQLTRLLPLFLAALMAPTVAGCGDDGASARPQRRATAPHPSGPAATVTPLATQSSEADPLVAPDGLASGASDADPLTGSRSDQDDPLASATGPKMPTAHSHWLRGRIFNARVGVRVNGILLGEFSAPLDRDITMKLHPGINTVSFSYQPLDTGATARLELLESEHTPPVPPLATFQRPTGDRQPQPTDQTLSPRTDQTTQTETFIAR